MCESLPQSAQSPPKSSWYHLRDFDHANSRLLLAAAVITGLALRLLFLGSKSLWLDEARSLLFAQGGAGQLWAGIGEKYHPPLYYVLLHQWIVIGQSEFALRLSSVLVDTLAILLIYALGRKMAGRAVGLSAAWLAALSPLLIWYAQEVRSYSLLTMLGLLTALALVQLVMHPSALWWLLFVVSMTAALYTHYNAVLLIPVHLILLLFLPVSGANRRRGLLAWLVAWPLIGLFYWPWLSSPGAAGFMALLTGGHLYPAEFLATKTGISQGSAMLIIVVMLIAVAGVAVAVVAMVQRRWPALWQTLYNSAWLRGAVIALFLLAVLVTVVPRGYSVKRLGIVLWPYVLITVAWLFPWNNKTRRPLMALLLVSLAGTLLNITLVPKEQWRELVTHIVSHSQPGDVVWIQPGWHNAPFTYYLDENADLTIITLPASAEQRDAVLQQHERIWHVYQTYDLPRIDPSRTVQRALMDQMEAVDDAAFYRVHATLYDHRRLE